MKTVRMLRDDKGAPEGHTTFRYLADSEHTLPDSLAEAFVVHRKSAVYVEVKGDAAPVASVPPAPAPVATAANETVVVQPLEVLATPVAEFVAETAEAAADETPAAEPVTEEQGEVKGDARRRRR